MTFGIYGHVKPRQTQLRTMRVSVREADGDRRPTPRPVRCPRDRSFLSTTTPQRSCISPRVIEATYDIDVAAALQCTQHANRQYCRRCGQPRRRLKKPVQLAPGRPGRTARNPYRRTCRSSSPQQRNHSHMLVTRRGLAPIMACDDVGCKG